MLLTQDANTIQIETSLGKDRLYLSKFDLVEQMSAPFSITVSCFTSGVEINQRGIIGKSAHITLKYQQGHLPMERYFHGVIHKVRGLGRRTPSGAGGVEFRDYEFVIQPQLAFLRQRKNCRIYQKQSVIDIVSKLLAEHDVKFALDTKATYPKLEYKVQYDESDFDFVQRLLRDAGLFYFFEHKKTDHILVLADSVTAYRQAEESYVTYTTGTLAENHVHSWSDCLTIPPGKNTNQAYDFLNPDVKPSGDSNNSSLASQQTSTEVFNYVAESEKKADLNHASDIELAGLRLEHEIYEGKSSCSSFAVGHHFAFSDHEDRSLVGRSYLITSLNLRVEIANQVGANKQSKQVIENHFRCISADTLFRSSPTCSKPTIMGAQTALVTGEEGEEVCVDEYGRIKVLFHWDREGKANNQSSCWVRVVQSWAGNGYGSCFWPRVGHEVLVSFLEGDPDQPVITGTLHNGNQHPPYSLPSQKFTSGIKTRSAEGSASNFNELRFVDKKGEELLYLQAEKTMQTQVKDSCIEQIEKDLQSTVGGNWTLNVGDSSKVETGSSVELLAGESITIKTGSASITLSSGGEIDIKGSSIKINGSDIALSAGSIALN
jgi:type VI secretion system secreted protein VgrG